MYMVSNDVVAWRGGDGGVAYGDGNIIILSVMVKMA